MGKTKVILASGSPRRKEILQLIGVDVDVLGVLIQEAGLVQNVPCPDDGIAQRIGVNLVVIVEHIGGHIVVFCADGGSQDVNALFLVGLIVGLCPDQSLQDALDGDGVVLDELGVVDDALSCSGPYVGVVAGTVEDVDGDETILLGEAGNVFVLLLDIEAVGGDELNLELLSLASLGDERSVLFYLARLSVFDSEEILAFGETASECETVDLVDGVAVVVFLIPMVVVLAGASRDGDTNGSVVDTVASRVYLGEGDGHWLDERDLACDVARTSLVHLEANCAVDCALWSTRRTVDSERVMSF